MTSGTSLQTGHFIALPPLSCPANRRDAAIFADVFWAFHEYCAWLAIRSSQIKQCAPDAKKPKVNPLPL